MSSTNRIIALWAVPRSVSTAFERMMAARRDFRIVNEPFSRYYYFGPERVSTRYDPETPSDAHDPEAVTAQLRSHAETEPVFFKDMAYHVRNYMTPEWLRNFSNAILIRDPRRSIPSLYKRMPDFTIEETGFEQLQRLAGMVEEATGAIPPVVDGENLRANAEAVGRAWCEAIGIEFMPESMHWESGGESHWTHWGEWYKDAAESEGFKKPEQDFDEELLAVPRVSEAVDRCLPMYETLLEHDISR